MFHFNTKRGGYISRQRRSRSNERNYSKKNRSRRVSDKGAVDEVKHRSFKHYGGKLADIEPIIHQIFYSLDADEGDHAKKLSDFPRFVGCSKNTQKYCSKFGIQYKFWDNDAIHQLLDRYPKYRKTFIDMLNQEQRTKKCCAFDFVRYVILYEFGGIYIDLDVDIVRDNIRELFEKDIFTMSVDGDHHISVMGGQPKNRTFLDIADYSAECFYEKKDMPIYQSRIGRFVFHTTGSKMIGRFSKQNGDIIEKLPILSLISSRKTGGYYISPNPYFYETSEASWYFPNE